MEKENLPQEPFMSHAGRVNASKGYPVAVLSTVVLSTTAVFIRYLTKTYGMPALVLAFWRDIFTAASMAAILAMFRPGSLRLERKNTVFMVLYGLMLALFNSFWTISVALNGAAVSTVLAYSSAAFTALLARILFHERLGWSKAAVVVTCLCGCALVSGALEPGAWQTNVMGISGGILSGLWYAGYNLMGRSASKRRLNPWTTVMYTFGVASCTLLAANLVLGRFLPGGAVRSSDLFWLGSATEGWFILFLLAAGPTLAGFGLLNVSLNLLPSSVVNLILTMEPALTAIIAYLFLRERLSTVQVAGSMLILGSLVFLRFSERRYAIVSIHDEANRQ